VVTYNISALEGNATALQGVFAGLHADDRIGPAQPIDIICFQECPQAAVTTLGNLLAASAPVGVTYTRATYTTSSSEDGATGAQALFYRTGRFTEITSGHVDLSTGRAEVRRSRRLVISHIATVGNYEYGFYWYLYLDGNIQLEAKLTGIVSPMAVAPGDELDEHDAEREHVGASIDRRAPDLLG
jgi:hypothetical protein